MLGMYGVYDVMHTEKKKEVEMDFNCMTKPEILEYLKSRGVNAILRARKATLVALAEELFEEEMKANEILDDVSLDWSFLKWTFTGLVIFGVCIAVILHYL